MNVLPIYRSLCLVCASIWVALTAASARGDWIVKDMIGKDQQGRPVYRAMPVGERFRNSWPEKYEEDFQARARKLIAGLGETSARGNTFFENEKRWYGTSMAHILTGDEAKIAAALKGLQEPDNQKDAWHKQTDGIDYYACFTIKHQMRKYFYFGDLLDPAYKKQMYSGAKKWTAQDPLRRPHYAFTQRGPGWGPDVMNSWVDIRSTENLFLMRTTSVYLMAEETGNKETTAKYKDLILDYTATLYRIGMGEWDSENYHGHSMAPVYNLYDFARDEEVKLAAKAILDFFHAVGAVKYYRGAFNGPTKRDYNHVQPFGGSAASMLFVSFGDCPISPEHFESDEVHPITSAYRPPVAVVKLARGEHIKPVEIFASKPPYSATTGLQKDAKPEYLETQYIADSYKLGSLASGTSTGGGDVSGFKLAVWDDEVGGRVLQASPTSHPGKVGSPQYQEGIVTVPNRVAQYKNKAIWLAKDGKAPWLWVIPDDVTVSEKEGVTFLKCDHTWVAILPLGMAPFREDASKTREITEPDKKGKNSKFLGHKVIASQGREGTFCGFAVIAGENESHGGFDTFQTAALKATLQADKLNEGVVTLTGEDGKSLGIFWNDDPGKLGVIRDGELHDFAGHAGHLYCPAGQEPPAAPISAAWGEGELYVEAGGDAFRCAVGEDGRVTFANGKPGDMMK